MSQLDEVEYARLETQVQEIEKLVNSGQPADVGFLLKNFLHNAKSRMAEIRQDEIRTEGERKDQKEKVSASIAQLVEMEHKLNAEEKQQYAGFLKLDYFTKANFDELDQFYTDSWDKLSESGKTQMSYRVWEGIRQGECTFSELPEKVRQKEAERLYGQLTGVVKNPPALTNIPEQDRAEFIREHEAGNEKAAAEVLNRKSFSMNVSTTSSKDGSLRDPSPTSKKEAEEKNASEIKDREGNEKAKESAFHGFTLADSEEAVKPNIPLPNHSVKMERG